MNVLNEYGVMSAVISHCAFQFESLELKLRR